MRLALHQCFSTRLALKMPELTVYKPMGEIGP